MPRIDLVAGLGFLALGLAVAFESWRMPRLEHLNVNPYTIPGLVPGLLGIVLASLGLALAMRSWRRLAGSGEPVQSTFDREGLARLALTLVLTVGFAAGLVSRVPFAIAVFVFVTSFIWLFERNAGSSNGTWPKQLVVAVIIGGVVAAAVTLVFERVFLVRLP